MRKEVTATADTVEEATAAAKLELQAPDDVDVSVEVLEAPQKSLFKKTPAKVLAYYEESEFAGGERYLSAVLKAMGIASPGILTIEEEDGVRYSIDAGMDYGYVVGRRGETLDALQFLTRLVVSRKTDEYQKVNVNVGDYRERREATLRDLAARVAAKAKKQGRNQTLDPMTPFDRRTVHSAVQEIEGVTSFSVGQDAQRRVVIAPDEKYKQQRRPGGYGNRGGYNNNRGSYGDRKPYGGSQGGYGERKPYGDRPQGGYSRPSYGDKPQGGYGDHKPYGDRPQRGYSRPSYGDKPVYGERKPYEDRRSGSYGNAGSPYAAPPQGGGAGTSSQGYRTASAPPSVPAPRAPRSEGSGYGRYGKITPPPKPAPQPEPPAPSTADED